MERPVDDRLAGTRTRRAAAGRTIGAGIGIAALLAAVAPAAALTGNETIRAFAGSGEALSSGDGGPATAAGVLAPIGISGGPDGSIVIPAPSDHRVRVVNPAGVINTVAGTGVAGFSGDGGPATLAQLDSVVDAAFDSAGNLYLADRANHRVRRVGTDGIITTIAGNGVNAFAGDGGPATAASLNNPVGVAVDAAGNIYIADEMNRRVRVVNTAGVISTVAGTGAAGSTGDGGPATAATIDRPIDVRTDRLGNLFIADNQANRIRRVAPDGIISTIAGNGEVGSTGDGGAATAARLAAPIEIAPDAFGNLYIADSANNRVRRVNAAGIIETIAGTGTAGSTGNGGPALSAQLNAPSGVVLNADGDLFVAERLGNRVRVVENPESPTAIPAGSSRCAAVPERPAPRPGSGRVVLSAEQLLINQRISQAAVRRVNGVQAWLDAKLATGDLCGGAFVAQSFGPGITVGATSTVRPEVLLPPTPRPVAVKAGQSGGAAGVRLEASQLLISQRISQAAVRRANALTERLDAGLTGGDLRPGAVTPAKIAAGLTVVGATLTPTPAASRTVVAPAPRRTAVRVELSARQILINQRIAQAAVRRSNALVDRLRTGFGARDFRTATITFSTLAASARP